MTYHMTFFQAKLLFLYAEYPKKSNILFFTVILTLIASEKLFWA